MKKISLILMVGVFAVSLLAGCGNQPNQAAVRVNANNVLMDSTDELTEFVIPAEVKTNEASILLTAAKTDEHLESQSPTQAPNDDCSAVFEAKEKIEEQNEPATSDTPQEDSDAFIGGWLVTAENGRSIPKPKINVELDLNKDGMIDCEDYSLSNMSEADFADKMVENGNVGTKGEAEMVISGELAVMCGVIH